MRFRRGATLDTGQVTDVRGRRVGGPLALGGGGLGIIGLLVFLLISWLSGGGGLGQLGPLDGTRVGQGDTPSTISQDCRTGQDANEREDCRIVAVVNSVQKFWDGVFQRSNRQYQYVDTVFFTDAVNTGCGVRELRGRAVLLPGGQAGLHRPRLLRRRPDQLGVEVDPVRPGLRDRARVRAPRPGPARRAGGDPRRRAGAGEQGRALGAPGRLLRGRLGGQCGRDRADRGAHAGGHQLGPRRGGGDRRRPDPGEDPGPGRPRSRGRTAPRSSAAAGSRAATRTASPPPATRSPARSRLGSVRALFPLLALRRCSPAAAGSEQLDAHASTVCGWRRSARRRTPRRRRSERAIKTGQRLRGWPTRWPRSPTRTTGSPARSRSSSLPDDAEAANDELVDRPAGERRRGQRLVPKVRERGEYRRRPGGLRAQRGGRECQPADRSRLERPGEAGLHERKLRGADVPEHQNALQLRAGDDARGDPRRPRSSTSAR